MQSSSRETEGMGAMARERRSWILGVVSAFAFQLLVLSQNAAAGREFNLPEVTASSNLKQGAGVMSQTYLSHPFTLAPGDVSDNNYRVEFPRGHIGIKGFDAEVVDEEGNSVPLHEVYLHHWLLARYHVADIPDPKGRFSELFNSTYTRARNDGLCQDTALDQIVGVGSETRRTNYTIPNPYAIVQGDPSVVPAGYHEDWLLNVHAIDTRSAVDKMGCIECRCDLYGALYTGSANYTGGIYCCRNGYRCAVTGEPLPEKKTYYLKYTVHWVEWNPSVVPVRVYVLDVTDSGLRDGNSLSVGCAIEYTVPACDRSLPAASCVHVLEGNMPPLLKGGRVVYGLGHQHAGGLGTTLYHEDGREICNSDPIYGTGTAAGDEAGYIVGMNVCYPQVNIYPGEKLRLQSRYSTLESHTGVMGLFYLLVADSDDAEASNFDLASSLTSSTQDVVVSAVTFGKLSAACTVIVVIVVILTKRRQTHDYQQLR